jgi:hypothetical protein
LKKIRRLQTHVQKIEVENCWLTKRSAGCVGGCKSYFYGLLTAINKTNQVWFQDLLKGCYGAVVVVFVIVVMVTLAIVVIVVIM